MKNNEPKRPRGRPATGRKLTHEARVLLETETWDSLKARAAKENISVAALIRDLIGQYLGVK